MFAALAGWIPAIILPTATSIQLYKIVRYENAEGVSTATWLLLALANLGLYVFAEKYFAIQMLLACLVTAVLDILIVIVAKFYQKS